MDSDRQIAYYSRQFQSVAALAPVQKEAGGVFVTNRRSTRKAFRHHHPSLELSFYNKFFKSSAGHLTLRRANIIVAGAGYPDFLPMFTARRCMVFHGTYGTFSEENIRLNSHFDHLFLIGPRMEQMLLRHNHKYKLAYTQTGFIPFADFPDKTDTNRMRILGKLGLDPAKKTILYTPSRASIGTWMLFAEDIANQLPPEYNLVMRPHPSQSLNAKRKDLSSFTHIRHLLKTRGSAILDLTLCSLPELESVADLHISDTNSPAEESLYYDIPQLLTGGNKSTRTFFKDLYNNHKLHPDDIKKQMRLFDCGPSFVEGGFRNWEAAVTSAMDQAGQYAATRRECFEWIFGSRDRNAAKRVADVLLKMD